MAIAAAAASALVWLHPGLGHDNATVPQSNAQPVGGDLAALLDQVQVVDSIPPVDGYDRGCGKGEGCVFGPAWNDPLDHSGCDTRFLGDFSVLYTRDVETGSNQQGC